MSMIFSVSQCPKSQNRNTLSSTAHFILFRVMVDIKALLWLNHNLIHLVGFDLVQ